MLIEHRGARPEIHESAYVAPSAVLCGAVRIGERARILHGAVLTAEDGEVHIGVDTVVMENALIRGRSAHPARIGDGVLVGPHAHVNGARVEDEVFVATGASLFPGSVAEIGSELRINSVLQINSRLVAGMALPIGWVGVGDPAELFPPERHDDIWRIQRELDFSGTVYGVPRTMSMRDLMRRQADYYGEHRHDRVIGDHPSPNENSF
ncbi:hypothetical protein GCM10009839_82320 [Catenulispora yoronensis]|uniref:Gamma carbonic anhydrase family protein n=1 Tax=Catenulispora yoronensis TaxID=450799 RepID=A0ABP5GWQ7_9ACTN